MRGFQLYAIIVAISCLTLQEASCKKSKPVPKAVSVEEEYEDTESVVQPKSDYNCEEYKSDIWDQAFCSQDAMSLMDRTLETAKVLGTNGVCSDTTRVLFNFIDVISTNEFAFYSMRMMYKMIAFIILNTDTSSELYKTTQNVISQIFKDPAIRELTWLSLVRPIKMLNDKVIRKRALRTLIAIVNMVKPPETEKKPEPSLHRSPSKRRSKRWSN